MTDSPLHWEAHDVASHPCLVHDPPFFDDPEGSDRKAAASKHIAIYLHDAPSACSVSVRQVGSAAAWSAPPDAWTRRLLRAGIPVIAPQAATGMWLPRIHPGFDSQLSPLDYVRHRVLSFATERYSEANSVALFGSGLGGQGVLQLAYRYPDQFPVVAALRPAIDIQNLWRTGDPVVQALYEDPEAARQDSALLYIHPLNWPRHQFFACDPADEWYEGCDRLRMKLGSVGVPFQAELDLKTQGDKDAYAEAIAGPLVDFLVERLRSERLRIV